MKVCIAEKPSVAREIARVLGATRQCDGFLEGNGYRVTWTVGHLCELKYPEDYTPLWRAWSLAQLPMVPQRFGIRLKDDKGIIKQFHVIERLFADAEEIMDLFPMVYKGDAGVEMKNPVGSYSKQLSSTYNFILCERDAINRFSRVFREAGINVKGKIYASAAVVAESVVTTEEKEEGVAIVDIGSGVTDVAVYYGNVLTYVATIPIGGSAINNDIRHFNGYIPAQTIENLKKRYGSALAAGVPDNTTVPVKTAGHAKKQILQRNIAEIAEERIKDIAGFVMRELKAAKFSTKLPCGVVLTGGSAYLSGIEELFARELDMEVRLGRMLNGLDDESQQRVSAFPQSAVMGLLLYGAKHNACETMPEFVRSNEPVIREPEKREPEKKDIFTAAPQSEKEEVQPANDTPVLPKEELPSEIEPEKEYKQEEEIVAPPKDDPIKTEKPTEQSPKREPKSGWLDRFRHWVDDMFTDEYI